MKAEASLNSVGVCACVSSKLIAYTLHIMNIIIRSCKSVVSITKLAHFFKGYGYVNI